MGLLKSTKCVSLNKLHKFIPNIKESALIEFIKIYNYYPNSIFKQSNTYMLWGYEVEFMILREEDSNYKLVLNSEVILEKYNKLLNNKDLNYILMIEYGRYMLEITTKEPFNVTNKGDLSIENTHKITSNLFLEIDEILKIKNSFSLIMTTFPIIGYNENKFSFIKEKELKIKNENLLNKKLKDKIVSKYFPYSAISFHNRFPSLTNAIIENRGSNISGKIFLKNKEEEFIEIDSMGQGMGNSSLHVTISINDSLYKTCELYDQLIPLTPIMLYLSRATSIIQGKEVLSCHRWEHLSISVDDRNQNNLKKINRLSKSPRIFEKDIYDDIINKEKDIKTLLLPKKSRCSSVDFYLNNKEYNDIDAVINIDAYLYLIKHKIPEGISLMIANECAYDPILLYEDDMNNFKEIKHKISNKNINYKDLINELKKDNINNIEFIKTDLKDNLNVYNFLNIHSTNWRSIRLKIPEDGIWKVEFRTMETQFSAFENSCFTVFIIIFSQVVLNNNIDLRIPISLVDINFLLSNIETFNLETKIFELIDIINNKIINNKKDFKKINNEYFYKNYKIIEFKTQKNYSPQKFFFKYKNKIGFGCLIDYFNEILLKMEELAKLIGKNTLEKIQFMKKKIKGEYKSNSQIIRELFNEGLKINKGNIIKANNFLIKKIKEIKKKDDKKCNYFK